MNEQDLEDAEVIDFLIARILKRKRPDVGLSMKEIGYLTEARQRVELYLKNRGLEPVG